MRGTAKNCDIFNVLKLTLSHIDIKLNNLSGVVTRGALSMIGKNEGLVAIIKKKMSAYGTLQLM